MKNKGFIKYAVQPHVLDPEEEEEEEEEDPPYNERAGDIPNVIVWRKNTKSKCYNIKLLLKLNQVNILRYRLFQGRVL